MHKILAVRDFFLVLGSKSQFGIGLILGVCVIVLVCWVLGSHFELGESTKNSEAPLRQASTEGDR